MMPATPVRGCRLFTVPDLRSQSLILLLTVFGCAMAAAAPVDDTVAGLWQQASARRLGDQPAWLALLHQRKTSGDAGSYVDDPRFFLAPDGADDPEAELRATLHAMVNEPATRCRFPARYNWLNSQLDFSDLAVATEACSRYDEWRRAINASTVVLVLAASYVNSPSSMYGHTFLRFDPDNMSNESPLLSYALNFGATVGEDDAGLLYAWRGVVGGYPGQFVGNAYLDKVKEYVRLENRDLWEYRLDFSPAEVGQMLAHVWELDQVSFAYFFFDENCSFRLLELLDVARPDLDLTDQFGLYAIPVDTVKAVQQAGLVEDVYFRPSNQDVVTLNLELLDKPQRRLALNLSRDTTVLQDPAFLQLGQSDQLQVVYTAYKYLRYSVNNDKRDPDVVNRSYVLLQFLAGRDFGRLEQQQPESALRPDQGHETALVAVSGGAQGGKWFSDIETRIAYHDLLDASPGYPPATSLNMGRLVVRSLESTGVQLQTLDLLEITSVPVRDEFFQPIAWQTRVGLDREWTNGDEELAFQGSGGAGASYQGVFDGQLTGMIVAQVEYNPGFTDSKLDVGAGISLGYLRQATRTSMLVQLQTLNFIGGADRVQFEWQQNFVLTTNNALRISFKHSVDDSDGINEASVGYRFYF